MGGILNKKLGVDLYFVLFGVFGVFFIPAFFFFRMRSNRFKREAVDAKYKVDDSVDLDERSLRLFPGNAKEMRRVAIDRERTKAKIRELEKELYGF